MVNEIFIHEYETLTCDYVMHPVPQQTPAGIDC